METELDESGCGRYSVAANPTKTTAANAAAETCLSDEPAELVCRGVSSEVELELDSALELDPELE